ncbi:DciA family protein [Ornithinimicrobium sp. F0845]|uniref:DUF721 domain-containing protein n=1 Tax=Ornithinimicrobium sp. F0845 TaxID=2926412 RepID=UPI001FF3CFEE|nr:DciA family protein [Ornithinimicrobium sp. F0845]MCK0113472.1 DciA family protein [Ornithinimicrobium sp. F0845]
MSDVDDADQPVGPEGRDDERSGDARSGGEPGDGPDEKLPGAERPDPLAAAADALARARANARTRGFRPGQVDRSRTAAAGLSERRSGTGDGVARDPRLLDSEVDRLLAARGWGADVQVGAVIGRWPSIVGAEVAAHVEPLGFDGTVLTVQADSTAWATQMKLLSNSVLARVETEVGAGVVTEIVVRGPAAPSWRKGRLRARGRGPRDTYG